MVADGDVTCSNICIVEYLSCPFGIQNRLKEGMLCHYTSKSSQQLHINLPLWGTVNGNVSIFPSVITKLKSVRQKSWAVFGPYFFLLFNVVVTKCKLCTGEDTRHL